MTTASLRAERGSDDGNKVWGDSGRKSFVDFDWSGWNIIPVI